ncbi:hypothetical protein Hanom_Chr06g00562461 [Helianthus anomalus]
MGKTFLLKPDYNQNSALNDPQRRFAPRARLDILGNKIYVDMMLLLENIHVLTLFYHRTTRELFSLIMLFTMKIMSGRVNMTQAQLAALIQEQVAAALAVANAGGIPCSCNSY